ncbi:DUF2092 domain-containing protein [Streptomyces sp. NPDC048172]|uniref:DUF2092 domain-containing protein n=1 Tax=Streptomyces sp. NPDC048172 TaxID=3365505 RepID=UPI003722DA36
MAQIQPSKSRRKAFRYGVPVAIAGVAAATVGLVPALADAGDPDLPKITAEELVAKMAKSDVDQVSGTVKISTDLGLPSLPGGSGSQGGPFGGGGGGGDEEGKDGKGEKPSAAPQKKLTELASGEHTLRVAADGPDKQRVSIVEDAAEYSLIHNAGDLWAYDSGSNSAWHAKAPKGVKGGKAETKHEKMPDLTPEKAAKEALKAAEKSGTSASVDGTAKVAGRDAYQLVLTPKDAPDTTVGEIRIAVDADNGAPLKFSLTPKSGGKAVVDIGYKKVDFGKPDGGTFDFKPPKGTKVTEEKLDKKADRAAPQGKPDLSGLDIVGKGATWNKVAKFDTGTLAGSVGKENGGMKGLGKGESAQAEKLLDSFTDEAKGDFGTGRVFSTRLVNALMTDDGKVYVGAVTKEGLIKAADADAK